MIYLDYAATTPVAREVADIMYRGPDGAAPGIPVPSTVLAWRTEKQMELWRKTVADALDCDPGRLFFTSCGTEGTTGPSPPPSAQPPPGAAHRHHRRGAQCRAGTLPLAGAPGI